MAKTKDDLKSIYVRGARPDANDFADLIDSSITKLTLNGDILSLTAAQANVDAQLPAEGVNLSVLNQSPSLNTSTKQLTLSGNATGASLAGFLWAPGAGTVTVDSTSGTMGGTQNALATKTAIKNYVNGFNIAAHITDIYTGYRRSTGGQSLALTHNTFSTLAFNDTIDPMGLYTANEITIPETGVYHINCRLHMNIGVSGVGAIGKGMIILQYVRGSANPVSLDWHRNGLDGTSSLQWHNKTIYLSSQSTLQAGDKIRVRIKSWDSGGTRVLWGFPSNTISFLKIRSLNDITSNADVNYNPLLQAQEVIQSPGSA